jgi:hypothetical protein
MPLLLSWFSYVCTYLSYMHPYSNRFWSTSIMQLFYTFNEGTNIQSSHRLVILIEKHLVGHIEGGRVLQQCMKAYTFNRTYHAHDIKRIVNCNLSRKEMMSDLMSPLLVKTIFLYKSFYLLFFINCSLFQLAIYAAKFLSYTCLLYPCIGLIHTLNAFYLRVYTLCIYPLPYAYALYTSVTSGFCIYLYTHKL